MVRLSAVIFRAVTLAMAATGCAASIEHRVGDGPGGRADAGVGMSDADVPDSGTPDAPPSGPPPVPPCKPPAGLPSEPPPAPSSGPPQCGQCDPAQESRFVPPSDSVPVTIPACCVATASGPKCGLDYGRGCLAREDPGRITGACPGSCCRPDGMCGAATPSLGCTKYNGTALACRAAEGPYPGACACQSCACQVAACNASSQCTDAIARRSAAIGPGDVDAVAAALVDDLDTCLSNAGCEPMTRPGVCREPCPSFAAGGPSVQGTLAGCCLPSGMCGIVFVNEECVGYDNFQLSTIPHLPFETLTCRGAALARPDTCACDACKKELHACVADPECVGDPMSDGALSVERCLSAAGCEPAQLGYCR